MPKNKNRDYEKENAWAAQPEQKKRRAQRNKARRKAEDLGIVNKGDGKELDHTGSNRKGDLGGTVKVVSKKQNRKRQPKRDGTQD